MVRARSFIWLLAFSLVGLQARSEITLDGTIGQNPVIDQPGPGRYVVRESNGELSGENLFHSFDKFNLSVDETVNFTGTSPIRNIISRITGGPSTIGGLIESNLVGANLFFINSQGITLTSSAQIDVEGTFTISTADYLDLEGDRFFAVPGLASVLSPVDVSAFGFFDDPSPIKVNGAELRMPSFPAAGVGLNLNIIGGDISVSDDALLRAPSGVVNLVSAASSGEITMNPLATSATNLVTTTSERGDVEIVNSELNIGFGAFGNGLINIHGGQITLTEAAIRNTAFGDSVGGGLNIDGTDVLLSNARVSTSAPDSGQGGGIMINAKRAEISGGSLIRTETFSDAAAGDISIRADEILIGSASIATSSFGSVATGAINLDAMSGITFRGDPFSPASLSTFGPQESNLKIATESGSIEFTNASLALNAPQLLVSADTISVGESSFINTSNALALSADSIAFNSGSIAAPRIDLTSEAILIEALGRVSADELYIETGSLTLTDGGTIGAGSVDVRANEAVSITGSRQSFIFFRSELEASGSIDISTPHLTIADGGRLRGTTFGPADGGNIVIDVDRLDLLTGGWIDSGTASSATGDGGAILIQASQQVTISGAEEKLESGFLSQATGFPSRISSGNLGAGSGGEIVIGTPILALDNTYIETTAASSGGGDAGSIKLEVGSLSIINGAQISADTSSPPDVDFSLYTANGGSISVVAEDVSISGMGTDAFTGEPVRSGVIAASLVAGDAGDIEISANTVRLADGGTVSSEATFTGNAGSVNLQASQIHLDDATIRTSALSGGGGDIHIGEGDTLLLSNAASITSSVGTGEGDGGNLTIDPNVTILESSTIQANAFGGDGGNIDLNSDFLIADPESAITASSELGREGTIDIDSPESTVIEDLVDLPTTLLAASQLLSTPCAVRTPADQGSLVIARRQGIPVTPDNLLLSFDLDISTAASEGQSPNYIAMRGASNGTAAFRGGRYEEALATFNANRRSAQTDIEKAVALRGAAQAQQALGAFEESILNLINAAKLAERDGDHAGMSNILGSLANAYEALERNEQAVDHYQRAIAIAERVADNAQLAVLHNNLANHFAKSGARDSAIEHYLDSASRAAESGNLLAGTQASANAARLAYHEARYEDALQLSQQVHQQLESVEAGRAKNSIKIHLARSQMLLMTSDLTNDSTLRSEVFEGLKEVLDSATTLEDHASLAFA